MFRRRWSPTSKAFGLLALGSGLAASLLVRGYEARLEALRPLVGPQVPVVVASRDLSRGTVLSSSLLRVVEVPGRFAPPGAVPDVDGISGRILMAPLAEGEPLTATRLASPRAGPVAALVDPGLRAFTASVDVPPGTVRPGDLVDVLATFGGTSPHVETPAEGAEVLAVLDGSPGRGGPVSASQPGLLGPSPGTAGTDLVLLVTPETAERLALASAFAELTVTVRSAEERA